MKKCPKCKSTELEIIEEWRGMTISWMPGDSMDDGVKEMGDPYRVDAVCLKCHYTWRLRGVTQVNESLLSLPRT